MSRILDWLDRVPKKKLIKNREYYSTENKWMKNICDLIANDKLLNGIYNPKPH